MSAIENGIPMKQITECNSANIKPETLTENFNRLTQRYMVENEWMDLKGRYLEFFKVFLSVILLLQILMFT